MTPDAYQSAIEHAVKTDDRATIAAIGLRLAESAEAMTILLAKGYGTTGMGAGGAGAAGAERQTGRVGPQPKNANAQTDRKPHRRSPG
jgi:hypothetical protein